MRLRRQVWRHFLPGSSRLTSAPGKPWSASRPGAGLSALQAIAWTLPEALQEPQAPLGGSRLGSPPWPAPGLPRGLASLWAADPKARRKRLLLRGKSRPLKETLRRPGASGRLQARAKRSLACCWRLARELLKAPPAPGQAAEGFVPLPPRPLRGPAGARGPTGTRARTSLAAGLVEKLSSAKGA